MNLHAYFIQGIGSYAPFATVGIEVETQFIGDDGAPIQLSVSQAILGLLLRSGWTAAATKGSLVTEILSPRHGKILYELGRHNLEVSAPPRPAGAAVSMAQETLVELYRTARQVGAFAAPSPVVETGEDLLVVPDERDATWLKLDGRAALNLLASTSAVQFTVDVRPEDAIFYLNRLGGRIEDFLAEYPQEARWRRYVAESTARYRPDRYGGPLEFGDIRDYCRKLLWHRVIRNGTLVPVREAGDFDIPLFLRSVWWYFRLRRYGDRLCIEVRPLASPATHLERQFEFVRGVML